MMRTADSLEKTWLLGKIEGRRRRGWQRMRWLDSITNSKDMHLSQVWEIVKDTLAPPIVTFPVVKVLVQGILQARILE